MLEKFGVTLAELLAPPGALEARLVRSQLPAEAIEALERLRARPRDGVRRARAARPPGSIRRWPGPTQAARQQALAGTQDIEKKLVQHLKRRQETELGQLARARTARRCPNGKPQERVLTVAPFLARYGPDLLQRARAAPSRRGTGDALEAPSQPA